MWLIKSHYQCGKNEESRDHLNTIAVIRFPISLVMKGVAQ